MEPAPHTTKAYWEARVKQHGGDLDGMIFKDVRRDEFWRRAFAQLAPFKDMYVLDVACGWGRFSQAFDPAKYVGVDFCDGMLELARKRYPDHTFMQFDVKGGGVDGKYDIVYEVNSLKSLGMSYEQFFERFAPMARVAVVCIEADEFRQRNIYLDGS